MIFSHFFLVLNFILIFYQIIQKWKLLRIEEFLKDLNKKEPKTVFLILLNKHIFMGNSYLDKPITTKKTNWEENRSLKYAVC